MKTVHALTERELATVLHGLRLAQETGNSGDCTSAICGHFHTHDELTNREIDALCERLNCGPLAPPAQPIHTKDSDCTVNPETLMCLKCGVYHGDPCPLCKGAGFHVDGCENIEIKEEADDAESR